uniref:V-type proton ATPase subunit a n=1 Tax=Tetranychus urticae TaxID=32264 RepID=T1K0G2_TETUR
MEAVVFPVRTDAYNLISKFKIKTIYLTLNMLNLGLTSKCLIANCWCPVDDLERIHMPLRRGTERSGSFRPFSMNVWRCWSWFTNVSFCSLDVFKRAIDYSPGLNILWWTIFDFSLNIFGSAWKAIELSKTGLCVLSFCTQAMTVSLLACVYSLICIKPYFLKKQNDLCMHSSNGENHYGEVSVTMESSCAVAESEGPGHRHDGLFDLGDTIIHQKGKHSL